jgi:hypothetical protein
VFLGGPLVGELVGPVGQDGGYLVLFGSTNLSGAPD